MSSCLVRLVEKINKLLFDPVSLSVRHEPLVGQEPMLWEIRFLRKIKQLNSDLQAASIGRTSLFSDGWAVD